MLGGILLDDQLFDRVNDIIEPDDFYSEANARIYEAMVELASKGSPIDSVTLRSRLESSGKLSAVGGDEYLIGLTDVIPALANITHHAEIVREKSTVRRLILACHEIAARGYGDYGEAERFLDEAESKIFAVARASGGTPYEPLRESLLRTFQDLMRAAERKQRVTGLSTGFERLDRMTSGMHPGDLIIIAGRPGMGKTSFALNVCIHAAAVKNEDGTPTTAAIFSLEMPKEQLARRMLTSEARVDAGKVRTGMLTRDDWTDLTAAAGQLSELPIYIDDKPGISVMELRGKARRLKAEAGLGLIVVDYLQLMRASGRVDSREQEISEISRSLKGLAKELSIPIIALSQLNRGVETRGTKDKRPQLSDLRESGAIEQDADTIIFIYREEVYNRDDPSAQGIAELIIGKQRNGPTGIVKCKFFREYTRFDNLAEHEQLPDDADNLDY